MDAENALELTNKKFINRFSLMEEAVQKKGMNLSEMTLAQMDAVWNEIKKQNIQI